ncbi:MAG: sigma-70 family RNA polymerase sigma factor [candidate division NC10 bacterium]|nr:sigma-70 family RNA polymerase sigma factor [candidate division NC10 bacterium]
MNDSADLELVQRLQAGDVSALDVLMHRHSDRAYRIAFGITRNSADAEEVVQDVFLALYQKSASFEGRAALSTWLYRVATNAALMKRRGRRQEVEVSLEARLPTFREDGHRAGDMSFLTADWSQNPEADLLSQETRSILTRAIEGLPDAYRAVLLMRDVEGLSNEEVAEAMGESVAAIKSRLHRARMVLREELTHRLGPHERSSWFREWGKRLGLWKR